MNMQALSSGNSTDEKDWSKLKLEMVGCRCPETGNNSNKRGETLRCTNTGKLENCSATQQGSNACYKVGFSGLSLLCQGTDITFDK
jgi:hypothetical protein